ncbi:hypothetical protein BOX15_Mlig019468g3 [Macrostomum lignano]|uniref:Uncharacterized protein n=1 Tax=Macrostomum lignano TaxID=282301 RepID=A0A267FQC0_9PLAT|nr:hypothetical protein BOX15_Mlig019468g3 [Macrostomum lignano]
MEPVAAMETVTMETVAAESVTMEAFARQLNSQGNNNAQGAGQKKTQADIEADAKAAKRQAFIKKKLQDPSNLRMFTASENQVAPYWETITMADPRETFQSRQEPPGLTPELKRQFDAAVKLGSNTAKWHHENKGVVVEYLLFMKDESLNLLKPQFAAMIKKCSRRTKCFILITNRILNRQVGKFKWIKYLIVQIQGPDYTMVKVCNTMLERWFPEYKQRVVYNKQRYKFGIYTNESVVDNVDLYFPYQRTGKCATSFGDLPCETPYGATESRTALSTAWKANNKMFAAGNLLPNNGPVQNVQSYVYAYHPLGPHDRFQFRSQFGLREPPLSFKMRSNMGYPPSNVCGPDYPSHPLYYDKGAEGGEDDSEEQQEDASEEEEILDSSHFILADREMKAKFKLKKMKLIMNRRREWIFGNKQLGVPYPQVLLPTTSITENRALTRKEDASSKGKKTKKKVRAEILIRNIRFINEDNIYMEYCFEKEHLKRNPISPYPRSLVPGRELAERVNVNKVYIGPIKFDFVKDRRDELNQRFQMLGQAGSDVGMASQTLSEKSATGGGSGGGTGSGQSGKRAKAKLDMSQQSTPDHKSNIAVVSFSEFKDKLTQDAISAGNDPEDLLGKDRISAKNVDKIVPGWRSLVGRTDNIFEEVKTRLNVHRTLKDKYSNVKGFFNPQFDPYEDIVVTEPKSRVQPRVKRQLVKGIPISEANPQKVASMVDELMDMFKKEDAQPRST